MGRLLVVLALLSSCLFASGCAVAQAHRDQDQMRTALLDLYTNQVIDNLIRAHNRMPIIQLDYTQAQGMITVQSNANLTDAFTTTGPNANLLTGMLGLQNTNQITISASPVTTSNEVYDAYLQFLSEPDRLLATAEPPAAGTAHICRKCGDLYYWVPVWHRDKFFELALLSTAQRGKSLSAPDQLYARNIVEIIGNPVPIEFDPGAVQITLKLDAKIPNDNGTLIFVDQPKTAEVQTARRSTSGKKAPGVTQTAYQELPAQDAPDPAAAASDANQQYPFERYTKDATDPSRFQNPPLAMTDRIEISYEKARLEALKSQLQISPVAVKIRLRHNQPSAPTTEDLLQRTNFQLQQFNQNIVRESGFRK